ncbi:soluble calcium-activated nucleotidase 1 [Pectinophora gossypiella]|uniref:Apyrase n=1 Tax=Pectinophora gossypiella TaxID=13191 RepID=A0A1E1W0B6_PECGO|nr:soluble calcium-activated nucleotidase 1 [Pectinophora gossypiella]
MYDYYESEEHKMMKGTLRDWRKALRTPATYRVGNTVRIQPQFVLLVSLIGGFLLILFYYNWWTARQAEVTHRWSPIIRPYNATYPLTPALISGDVRTYRIGIVADLDTNSKSKSKAHTFNSYLKRGSLIYNPVQNTVTVTWDTQPATLLTSTYAQKGRGMELSELIVYDGRLLTFDDRSGVVFEIINNKVVPWVVLSDGNGMMEKGFKTEWATVKDEILYVGSMGKEWTTSSGEFQTYDPMWVKAVNMNGEVQHLSWVNQYKAVRMAIGIKWPGYMIHESGVWSPMLEKWHFLPRRCSHEPYNETRDEVMGCNYLITADANFHQIQASEITKHQPKLGFSSFKFIPGSRDEAIVALKTTEFEGKTATYITAFKTDGTTLMVDTIVENLKYEGIEFI